MEGKWLQVYKPMPSELSSRGRKNKIPSKQAKDKLIALRHLKKDKNIYFRKFNPEWDVDCKNNMGKTM